MVTPLPGLNMQAKMTYARGDSMIFKKIEKVVGLRQPAGRDYVQSKEYSSKLLNQVSKVREILTRRKSTENFRF